jgi:hypothetical protein
MGFEARPLRIIFLDFEGALVAPGSQAVAALNWLVAETGARLVLTRAGLPEWAETLRSWGVHGEIIGATGGDEIETWLDEHRPPAPVRSFVIFAEESGEGESGRVIRLKRETGLTREQAEAAATILHSVL